MKISLVFLYLLIFPIEIFAQFNYKIDTVFFKNEYVSRVSLGQDTNVWVIKNQNGREVGLVNTSAQQSDLSLIFQSYTNSSFTDIVGLDSNSSMVSANDDYILKYNIGTGIKHIDLNYGLGNNHVNSLVYVHNTLGNNNETFPNGKGVITGTDRGLYFSSDFLNFNIYNYFTPVDARFIARNSDWDYFLFDMDTSTQRYSGFINNYNFIISNGVYESTYSIFPSAALADSENVNSSLLAHSPALSNVTDRFIYYGSNHGLKRKHWYYINNAVPDNFIPNRTVYKLYDRTYFPFSGFEDYFIFIGTDSGLYCNRPNFSGTDSITLVPNTSQYKIMDIDGNICDNSLWLATDKGLVRLLLNYSPDLTFKRNKVKQSLYPQGTVSFCKTNMVTLTSSFGNSQYQWLKDGIPISGQTSPFFQTNGPGSYQVVITNSFCNYHISDTTLATVLQYDSTVIVDFNYPDTILKCHGQIQELDHFLASFDYTSEWYKNGVSMNNNSTTIMVSQTGFYKGKVFNCNGISKFTDSVLVLFDTVPTPTVYHPTQILCEGIPLNLSVVNYPYSVSWFLNGSEIIANRNISNLNASTSGTYKVVYTDNNQCSRYTEVPLQFNDIPDLTIQTNKSIPVCIGDSIELAAISSASIYQWSTGSNKGSIFTGTPGNYKITVISTQGCDKSDSIIVTTVQGPSVSLGEDTVFCEGDLIPILLKGTTGMSRYIWDNISTKESTYDATTAGYHTLTVYDVNNCSASDTIFINNNCLPLIFPNLITPNGDSKNETFFIQNLIPQCSLTISNRWGNLIYKSDNYENDWDGGNHSDGVYYYVLKSSYYKQEWKGWVEVIK